jgi:hypothetical protein
MPSHVNVGGTPAVITQPLGPDTTRNLRALKAGVNQDALCKKLAAAAKERGRPLTQVEIDLVGRGEPLPPLVVFTKPTREAIATAVNMGLGSTAAVLVQKVWDLEATVCALTERLEALEGAAKNSAPAHLRAVEKR